MSQDDQCRPGRRRGRPSGTSTKSCQLQKEMAKRMGISVRQAYRITAAVEQIADRKSEQHSLLARYVLLEVGDPGYTSVLTEFLDELLHTLIEEAAPVEPACLSRLWGRMAGQHIAGHINRAAALRQQRLNDSLDLSY